MNEIDGASEADLSATKIEQIEQTCDRFEAGWRMGRRPRIEDHLEGVEGIQRHTLFQALLAIELEYRREFGEPLSRREYLRRFPAEANLVRAAFGGARPANCEHERAHGANGGASADRDLLYGIVALQVDFITRDALIDALNAWVLDKHRPLGEILIAEGALKREDHELLEPMVARHIQMHGGRAEQSLAALNCSGDVPTVLRGIPDADVQASLAEIDATQSGKGDESCSRSTVAFDDDAVRPGGRFRILRFHAEGGLGRVYVARDHELHRDVALKQIKDQHADNRERRARFVVEAEITGGLEHPGIVPVYGLGQHPDGRPFYAMRLIQGDNLKDAIARFHQAESPSRNPGERALELRRLLGRFLDVCDAVAYAHSRGVLHRDLKPGNIMLGKFGETLVVDWGLAKSVGRPGAATTDGEATLRPESESGVKSTEVGTQVGTPAYMSPEQAAGRLDELGPASDVYSLGATLYCLLTGKPPFAESRLDELLGKVKRGEFTPPAVVNPRIERGLDAICKKAMTLRPLDRYPSPRQLADDIEHWLADEPIGALTESLLARARRWARRHRTAVAAACVALVVAAAGLAVTLVVQVRATARERAARQQAQTMRNHARDMLNTLVDDVQTALMEAPRTQALRRTILQTALARLRSVVDADAPIELDPTLAVALIRMARIHVELDDGQEAQARYERACRIGEAQARSSRRTPAYLVEAYTGLARSLEIQESPDKDAHALQVLRAAEPIAESLARERPADPATLHALLNIWVAQADLALRLGDRAQARQCCRNVIERAQSSPDNPTTVTTRRDLGFAYETLAGIDAEVGRFAEAQSGYEKMLRLRQSIAQEATDSTWGHVDLAKGYYGLGRLALRVADAGQADANLLIALRLLERQYEADPASSRVQILLVHTLRALTLSSLIGDDFFRARGWSDRLIGTLEELLRQRENARFRAELAWCCAQRGDLERADLEPQAALGWFQRSQSGLQVLKSDATPDRDRRFSELLPVLSANIEGCRIVLQEIGALKSQVSTTGRGGPRTVSQAIALACVGRYIDAAGIADELRECLAVDAETCYQLAVAYSACRTAVAHGRRPQELGANLRALRAKYALQAIAMLEQAAERGYNNVNRLCDDARLTSLQPLPQLQSLIERLLKAAERK
jgi:tetratricopeptide (TPR) repeat protein/tRNA A-37 threonylcarbamoyl transferase component Bud32